jgi:hypothetical protein
MEPLTKIKIFLIIFSSLLIAIPIAIEIAVLSGLLSILNALFILVLSAIALAYPLPQFTTGDSMRGSSSKYC